MTFRCKVLKNIWFNCTIPVFFKDYREQHMNYFNNFIIRGYFEIVDGELFMKSDFHEGIEFKIIRISENGRYDFHRDKRCFE